MRKIPTQLNVRWTAVEKILAGQPAHLHQVINQLMKHFKFFISQIHKMDAHRQGFFIVPAAFGSNQ